MAGWRPQVGPQLDAIMTAEFVPELLYGGARGGGKTSFLLGDFGQDVGKGYGTAYRGIIFRRTYDPELKEIITQSKALYPDWFPGAKYHETAKEWRFPGGEVLELAALERDDDAAKRQGHQFVWIGWDELGNWPQPDAYMMVKACLRSSRAQSKRGPLRIRASANPGGPGHNWVKSYFGIDRWPHGSHPFKGEDGQTRMFVKSRVQDNKLLLTHDPQYVDRLRGAGSAELVRAWLDGDWDAIVGAFFDCWSALKHVIKPFEIPEHWLRFRSMDWGSRSPFSVGWWAVASEECEGSTGVIPKGSMIRYREWYGASGPNKGLKWPADKVGRQIAFKEQGDDIAYGVLDPSAFKVDGGPSVAERLYDGMKEVLGSKAVPFRRADNTRVGARGAMSGWDLFRARLIGDDDRPYLYVFDTCTDFIRTIPALQHDSHRLEDLDTEGEDHAADEARYASSSRPWAKKAPQSLAPISRVVREGNVYKLNVTLDQLWKEAR